MRKRILIADDHPVVLSGLKQILASEPDMEVVATCTGGDEALREIRARRPHIAIVDVRMPRMDGLSILRAVSAEEIPTRIILISAAVSENDVVEALRHGVAGIVLKELAPQVLLSSVRRVAEGGQWLEKEAVARALEKMVRREQGLQDVGSVLTPREIEIVKLVCAGLRNKEIASRMNVTEGTVKVHLHSVYEKANVSGRLELMLYARDKGIL